jgi:alpha-tubulin suppressor-like RCC1 family protein
VTSAGQAFCWGDNFHLQLTGSQSEAVTSPQAVQGGSFTAISAGQVVSCGIAGGGAAYCWGTGFLGYQDENVDRSATPLQVTGGPWGAIDVAPNHTCGLVTGGAAYCWGVNGAGVLGDGTIETRKQPTAVAGGLAFSAIDVGVGHVCAIATAGAAYCWGANGAGQLGTGSGGGSSLVPAPVSGGLQFTQISAGELHSCAVASGGAAHCWGDNALGQLGTGDLSDRAAPAAVAGDARYESVSAGGGHSCGVTTQHRATCWGGNIYGELGAGTVGVRAQSPVEVTLPQ